MELVIHGAPLSPFVRKVRWVAEHKGLEYKIRMVVPYQTPDEYAELNPLRRVPALSFGDIHLADSSVICQFLDGQFPEHPVLAGAPYIRAKNLWLEKYADYELAPLTTFSCFRERIVKGAIGGQAVDEEKVASALAELPKHWDYLQSQLEEEFFHGLAPGLADYAIASQLAAWQHAGETLDQARWPSLASFYSRIMALPYCTGIFAQEQAAISKLTAQIP